MVIIRPALPSTDYKKECGVLVSTATYLHKFLQYNHVGAPFLHHKGLQHVIQGLVCLRIEETWGVQSDNCHMGSLSFLTTLPPSLLWDEGAESQRGSCICSHISYTLVFLSVELSQPY